MALIQCPECGKEISDKAKACVHCGCPCSSTATVPNFSEASKKTQSFLKSKCGKKVVVALFGLTAAIILICVLLTPKHISNIDGYWDFNDVYGEWLFPNESSIRINKDGTFIIWGSGNKIYSGEFKFKEIRHDIWIYLDDGERLEPDVYVYSLENCDFDDCKENEEIEILYYSFTVDGQTKETVKFQKREIDTKRPIGWVVLNLSKE